MIKFIDFISLILYCLLIYTLSSRPVLATPLLFEYQDKIYHALAYFMMGVLTWRSFKHLINRPIILFLISLVFCSVYGATDEWHQSFVEGRHADVVDWVADTFGALLAVTFLSYRLKNNAYKECDNLQNTH